MLSRSAHRVFLLCYTNMVPASSRISLLHARMREVSIALCLIFLGCCANNVFLELLVTRDPACGHVITFSQFLVITLAYAGVALRPRQIPVQYFLAQVAIFFSVSVINNAALGYDVPVTLHMIFRSGSLIANVVLGWLLLKRRVSMQQLLAVVSVTAGIVAVTLADAAGKGDARVDSNQSGSRILVGITMLTAALLLSALLGIVQEFTYGRFGKHPFEALFYSHGLSLPLFLIVRHDIVQHFTTWYQEDHSMFLYLAGNVVTQLVCITGVFRLTGASNSLTMTLSISLRKFVSLLISVAYFANPFTLQHWLGTVLVFAGTLLYSFAGKPSKHVDPTVKRKQA